MESKFQAKDFNDMQYNAAAVPFTKKVVDVFPDLKKYKEFNETLTGYQKFGSHLIPDKIFRYCLLMYTDNVIHRLIPEFAHRKREAALLAGFNLNDIGRFNRKVEAMMLCEYNSINRLIVRVVSFNKSTEFRTLVAFEDAFEAQQLKLRTANNQQKANEVSIILKNLNELRDNINKLRKTLLNEDPSDSLLDILYKEIEGVRLGITPEENANLLKDGKFDDFHKNPYEQEDVDG